MSQSPCADQVQIRLANVQSAGKLYFEGCRMGNGIRNVLDALADSPIPKVAVLVFAWLLTITLAIALTQNISKWVDTELPRGVASIDVWKLGMVIGTSGTATAFLVTLYVAERNYRRSREHIPSLSIDLSVVRVPVSLSYDAIIVTLNATNTGTGLCDVDQVEWSIRAVSPYTDNDVDQLVKIFEGRDTDSEEIEFPWRRIELEDRVTPLNISIEPKETDQTTQDFIIPAEVTAVVVTAWVVNGSVPKIAQGWYRRVVHTQEER